MASTTESAAPAARWVPKWRRLTWAGVQKRLPLVILTLVLLAAAVVYLMPLYWMFTGSLKLQRGIMQTPPDWFPNPASWENWQHLFAIRTISPWSWLKNSAIVSLGTVVVSVSLSALAGYAFAKKQFPGREVLFFILFSTMMLPSQVQLVPLYLFVRKLGLYNTYPGMILPMILSPFGIFLMRQFMQGIPNELLDASRIDGASEWGQFWKIAIPLSVPALSALSILTFFNAWGNFMWQLLMAKDYTMMTLPVGVSYLALVPIGERAVLDVGLLMAGGTFGAIPMMIFFLFFQKYFVQGLMMGALKG
jgi:multiple sugar transport system permease protein